MPSLPQTVAAIGSAVLVADYLDRKMMISRDLYSIKRLLPVLKESKSIIKDKITVADFWENNLKKYKDNTAIAFEGKTYTFGQLNELANRVAHWAHSKGIKAGDVVALYMENRPEFVPIWLGFTKIGAITAFINYNLKANSLSHCIKISNAKAVVFGNESMEGIQEVEGLLLKENPQLMFFCYGEELPFAPRMEAQLEEHSVDNPPKSLRKGVAGDDTWGFVYTSGTTGLPKAAIIKHVRFIGAASAFANLYDFTPQDRLYTVLPLYHSAGGMIGVGVMMYSGATIVLKRKFSASSFISDIREYNCTGFQYIGELCRYLLSVPPSPFDTKHKLRIAVGNGLRPDIWETFQTRFNIPIIGEFYAATEGNASLFNTVPITGEGRGAIGHMGSIMRKFQPIKIVKFDVEKEIPIRDKNGFCIECQPGEAGELIGQIVENDPTRQFAGYYKNKEGTEKKILTNVFAKGDKWFRTGDLLKMDEKGYYYFVDRIGDTFRWKGENVSTNEVAEAISTFPGIQEANVYGVAIPGKDGRAGMAAIVSSEVLDLTGLAAHVIKQLPPYAVPMFIRKLEKMDITGTFKHRKVELRDEGFDPSKVTDPIFFFDANKKTYVPLTKSLLEEIVSPKSRL